MGSKPAASGDLTNPLLLWKGAGQFGSRWVSVGVFVQKLFNWIRMKKRLNHRLNDHSDVKLLHNLL